jgi:ribonuclease P protein component
LHVSRTGRKQHSANFVVISQPNKRAENRLGITVSGKVGISVVRNRIKRQVREFFRLRRYQLPPAHDILIIARNGAAGLSGKSVKDELENTLLRQRVYRKA